MNVEDILEQLAESARFEAAQEFAAQKDELERALIDVRAARAAAESLAEDAARRAQAAEEALAALVAAIRSVLPQ